MRSNNSRKVIIMRKVLNGPEKILILLILLPVYALSVDYQWSEEYATSYDYSEINDMCSLLGSGVTGDQILLVGGAWDTHPRRHDADVVLIGIDPVDGSEDFESYVDVWQNGAVAYGACVNDDGNYLVTGACNIGNSSGDDYAVPFILEVSTSGVVLDEYFPNPEPRWNPQVGFDIMEHSNDDYYIIGGANNGYQDYVFVARYSDSFVLKDYWTYEPRNSSDESWSYANTICEIPSGYSSEGGWIVAAFNQSVVGSSPCLAALREDLGEITVRDFNFHCWETSGGSS